MKIRFAFFIALLLSATDAYALSWSDVSTAPSSGVQYSPNLNYNFQVIWNGDGYTVSNVLFESNFSTLTETLANITPSNVSNVYFVNFTGLPGGTFVYRWYAVDNESNWNSTNQFTYIINKNSSFVIRLFLNGTEGNRSYRINETANFTAFLNLSRMVYLNSNYPGFVGLNGTSIINNFTSLTSSGYFDLTAYWNGDENYSASSITYYFDNMPPQYFDRKEDPSASATYYVNRNYTFFIKWTDTSLSQVWFESNHTGTVKVYTAGTYPSVQNTSNSFNITLLRLPAETFTYRWLANDSLNQVASTNQYNYYVWKASPLLLEVTPSNKVINGTETTVKCYTTTIEVIVSNFKLYRNSTLIANDTIYSRKDQSTLDAGRYEYICNSTETQNFTNQSIFAALTVNLTQNYTGSLNLNGPSSLQASPGQTFESEFFLENNLGYTLSNFSLSLTGIDSVWYNIEDYATTIPNSFSLPLRINFNIPADAIEGDYSFTLKAVSKSPSNETKTLTKFVTLTVATSQPQSFPPVYSPETANTTANGDIYEFALKWTDDSGLSGYVFSSNITGEWINDSWIPLSGTEGWSYSFKNITVTPGATISWKFYVNDSNNFWSDSLEFNLETAPTGFDFLPIIIVTVFVIILAAIIIFITQKTKKAPKKEEVTFVYRREDIKTTS